MPRIRRNLTIVGSVLVLHIALVWSVQNGLLHRAQEPVPAETILVSMVTPTPIAAPEAVPQAKVPAQAVAPAAKLQPSQVSEKAPTPVAAPLPDTTSVANEPSLPATITGAQAPDGLTRATTPAAAFAGSALNSPPLPPKVELPSASAEYLNNPKPPYPSLSKRLGEQGRVVVRLWIGTDGTASQASVKQSSGFERLDQAALATVLLWRYVPGKRAGVAEGMWFDVPVNWELK